MKRSEKFNLEVAESYYKESGNITQAARKHCEELGIEYGEMYRNALSKFVRKAMPMDKSETEGLSFSAVASDGHFMNIEEYCEYYNFDLDTVKSYKTVTHSGIPFYNILFKSVDEQKTEEDFRDKLLFEIANLPNRPKTLPRKDEEDANLLVISPADVHIGKLCNPYETGDTYNSEIAVKRVLEGVEGILNKAKGFNINKILFVGGNDILHVDTPKNTTTAGTTQDVSGPWYENFLIAKDLYILVLERLLEVADVEFVFNPSNHDYQSGFFLANLIEVYFKDCKNITFDCSIAHRKYSVYGQNLIGTTHGDGAKQTELPLLMASESPYWSTCKHRYIYGHHVHHKISKDYIGVTFETLRSPSGTDGWHMKAGYTGVPKAIEGFIHHPEFGQVARFTHIF